MSFCFIQKCVTKLEFVVKFDAKNVLYWFPFQKCVQLYVHCINGSKVTLFNVFQKFQHHLAFALPSNLEMVLVQELILL